MVLATIISCIAVGISAASLMTSLHVARRDRVNLRAWATFHPTDEYNEHPYITVVIVNEGRRPAILRLFGGDLVGGGIGGRILGKDSEGIRLGESERHEESVTADDSLLIGPDGALEYRTFYFEDTLGNRHPVRDCEEALNQLRSTGSR